MTNKEIREYLEKIHSNNILNAFILLDNDKERADGLIRKYVINYNYNNYSPPEVIRLAYKDATGNNLPENIFINIGENSEHFKFIRNLGFEIILKQIMYKYYLKKASNQDITRTTVINTESVKSFFGLNLTNRDEEETIKIKYLNTNLIDDKVVIRKKQDYRIYLNKEDISENDILLFKNEDSNIITLEVIKTYDAQYTTLNHILKNNYLLSNNLESETSNIFSDLAAEYITKTNQMPLNQILYGPPGTGKTYSTITKALNIIGLLEEKDSYSKAEYEKAQELFQNELGNRIEFVTMHQSFSYEDFVQGLKPNKSEGGNGITFDYKNGVFKEISKRADLLRLEFKSDSIKGRIDFEVVYNYSFKSLFEDNEPVTIDRGKTKFTIHEFSDKTLWFETSNGTTHPRYTLAKKTLKKIYDSQINDIIKSGNKGYFDAALEFLLDNEKKIKEKTGINAQNQNINHVIILDEINRANISRVFGELIALIEKDKRDGKLTASLPSGERFSVPSNLYIIGTMNTADKSIALVDIALRRRFKFIPLYPNIDLLISVLKDYNFNDNRVQILTNLNKIIRAKKSVDFEIGHSYFMENDTLINILNHQVLPLLNEYFMYDLKKVKEIIEQQQNDREGNKIPKLGIRLNQTIWREKGLLEVESIDALFEQLDSDVNYDSSELDKDESNI
jgi:hypothetical protein